MFYSDFNPFAQIFKIIRAHLCKVIKIIATLAKKRNIMTVERETAGFALPFAAGTAAAIYAGASSGSIFIHILTTTALAFLMSLLLADRRRQFPDGALRVIIMSTALAAGAFCGLISNELAVTSYDVQGFFDNLGTSLETAADRIPFKDTRTNEFIKAILTGERRGMSQDVTDAFRKSGASHILALSGLHLGVIYMMISRALSLIGFSPRAVRARSAATILLCGTYTLATGAGPSIVRAFLFIVLNEAARLSGRYRSTGNVLLTALVIQSCISPASLKSVGFQLSYAAMAGIAYIYPWMKGLWPEGSNGRAREESVANAAIVRPTRWLWNSIAMSVSCQAATAPLVWMYFRTFPTYFILTNLIALPLTGVLMPSAALTLMLSMAGICPDLLVRITEWLAGLLIGALGIIAVM